MEIKKNILSIADSYDTFFVDLYGVLYNGATLYDNTLETMQELKRRGKKIIIVSNATQIAEKAKRRCERYGMYENIHYNAFVTSGEYLRHALSMKSQEIFEKSGVNILYIKCLFEKNDDLFAGLQIAETPFIDKADLAYVGTPKASYGSVRIDNLLDENNNPIKIEDAVRCDWRKLHDPYGRKGAMEFARVLEECLEKNKTILIANPDIFAYGIDAEAGRTAPIFAQGIIGKYYEKLGGKVIYFGKPHKGIFEFAQKFVNPKDRIVMIGDTPWTDIKGAKEAGIDSAMVMTGVFGQFLKNRRAEQEFETLYKEISLKMSHISDIALPTHALERFAG